MTYKVVISKNAQKQLHKLTPQIRKRMGQKIMQFSTSTDPLSYAVRLTDPKEGQYRWRIGNYRVIFDIDGNTIAILKVQHRKDVYR